MINWKLRLKNKTTLTAIVMGVVALIYQVMGIAGITPAVSENEVVNIIGVVINLLVMVGVVTDPTTAGIADSNRAMGYTEPNKD